MTDDDLTPEEREALRNALADMITPEAGKAVEDSISEYHRVMSDVLAAYEAARKRQRRRLITYAVLLATFVTAWLWIILA